VREGNCEVDAMASRELRAVKGRGIPHVAVVVLVESLGRVERLGVGRLRDLDGEEQIARLLLLHAAALEPESFPDATPGVAREHQEIRIRGTVTFTSPVCRGDGERRALHRLEHRDEEIHLDVVALAAEERMFG
jgi:hypothetical protein